MKQIWPNYSYSPTTNVLTLTGLNIDRDQLLLVAAPERGRIMYNFADSSVTASAFTSGANTALTLVATTAGLTTTAALVIYYDDQLASTTVTVSFLPAISGTVNVGNSVTISSLPSISGTVTLGAGTAQIGSVTASISGTVPISISSVTVGNSVTIGSLPSNATGFFGNDKNNLYELFQSAALNIGFISDNVPIGSLPAGTAQIGSVTASISNSVVTFYPLQGTTVTNSNFTSTTASTTLVSAVAGREVLTVFNEGAGNLHISPGATCTTAAYQVRLSAGDYWECPQGQLSLAHTAVFATAGTARVTQVS